MKHERPSRVVAAALLTVDGKIFSVPAPGRHHDVIRHMREQGVSVEAIARSEQGFTTDTYPFIRRQPALRVAERAGQILKAPIHPKMLFSEDLW